MRVVKVLLAALLLALFAVGCKRGTPAAAGGPAKGRGGAKVDSKVDAPPTEPPEPGPIELEGTGKDTKEEPAKE
jgi:hypothetical protein